MRIALLGMFGEWCLGTNVLNFVMVEHPVAYLSNQVSFSWVCRHGHTWATTINLLPG